jgi:uncharacterized membrane protein YcaP (DUF421 family)
MQTEIHALLAPLWPVVGHTIAIYLFLILTLRILGRRPLGQLTVIDLVIVMLLGSAVETAMVNGNTTLLAGLACASTLLLSDRLLAVLFWRSRWLRHFLGAVPILLVQDGQFIEEHLRRMGLTHADVLEALREREEPGIEQIKLAVLETDGTINVVPKAAGTHPGSHKPAGATAPEGPAPPRTASPSPD